MRTCPCGFVAERNQDPRSPEWHRGHREKHLAAYPNVDAGTRASLDQLVDLAERGAIVSVELGFGALA